LKKTLIVSVMLVSLLAASCVVKTIEGSGDIETEARQVSGFDSIELSHMGDVYLTQGETEGLTVRADDNLLEYIVTEVVNGTLKLGVKREAALAKLREQFGGRGPGRDRRSGSTTRAAGEDSPRQETRPAREPATKPGKDRIEALIRLEALAGKVIHGYVDDISPMAEDKGWMSPGVKVHTAIVRFDEGQDISQLAPNMTAKVTLILERLEKVLKVPVAAVFSEGERHYCWRVRDGRPEKVRVEIGKTNDREVQIVSGLSENDEVLEAPPEGVAGTETPEAPAGPGGEEQGRP